MLLSIYNIYGVELNLQSEAAILIEKESGRVLFEMKLKLKH